MRHDVRVINGKVSRVTPNAIVSKLMPGPEGTKCSAHDISIVVDEDYTGDTQRWKLQSYELR